MGDTRDDDDDRAGGTFWEEKGFQFNGPYCTRLHKSWNKAPLPSTSSFNVLLEGRTFDYGMTLFVHEFSSSSPFYY